MSLGPTMEEFAERDRRFIEEEGPWNNGGKQAVCASAGIAVTHDELAKAIGPAYQQILDAGFVLVPKQWRERIIAALHDRSRS
jgi:hypothetical protein